MSTIRRITVAATVGGVQTIETNATSFGELKPLLSEKGYNVDQLTFVNGIDNTEFSLDSAVLPSSDFQILAFPKKNKFGSIEEDIETILDEVESINDKLNKVFSILKEIGTDLPKVSDITQPETINQEHQALLDRALDLAKLIQ